MRLLIDVVLVGVLSGAAAFFWLRVRSSLLQSRLTDPLTGLKNRRFVELTTEGDSASCLRRHAEWKALQLAPQNSDLAFVIVDLDDVALVTQHLGRGAADRLLVEVAHCLERSCRDSDVAVRWDEERFLVIGRFTNGAQATLLAERIRKAVAARVVQPPRGDTFSVTCSVGYAVFPLDVERQPLGWRGVMALSALAADDAKRAGGNRSVGYLAGQEPLPIVLSDVTEADANHWIETGRLRRESSADTVATHGAALA